MTMDMTLYMTALANLKTLTENVSLTHILIADGNVLSLIEKDSFDTICKLKSLEYPVFFTYQCLFNILTNNTSISYKQRVYLLENIEDSLENLMKYINDYEEGYPLLIQIINDIEVNYDLVRERTHYKRCSSIINLFDSFVDICRIASTCLYFNPYDLPIYSDDDDDDDGDDDDDDDDEYGSTS